MLVGFDEQVMRATPRAEVLVKRGTQLRGEAAGGGSLIVDLPNSAGDPPAADEPTTPGVYTELPARNGHI